VRVERRGDVAVWTLARPKAKNALDGATFDALERAIGAAGADRTLRAVVLTGEGDTFASGGDLRELRTALAPADAVRVAELGRSTCDGIGALDVPVIAALPGAAIGGGAELALACDLRIADPRATLCFKHAHMGVTTAWGVLPRLVAVAGHAAASRLLLAGRAVDAEEALQLGLFDSVSPAGGALDHALAWAAEIARGAPLAIAGMKALLREACRADGLRALERGRFVATWTSADHAEAVEAFFAGRQPRWAGAE
jgi:enoyl-CoA hydratase/carnithine racemase